jgi:hypothetical protein
MRLSYPDYVFGGRAFFGIFLQIIASEHNVAFLRLLIGEVDAEYWFELLIVLLIILKLSYKSRHS